MLINILFFFYLVCNYFFIFGLGSLMRIFLIVINALISSLILYVTFDFSWYLLLFVLVYVGGVYILFVYISLIVPNVGLVTYKFGDLFNSLNLFLLFLLSLSLWAGGGGVFEEFSTYLCSDLEFLVYLFFCLVLLLGVVLINFLVCNLSSSCIR